MRTPSLQIILRSLLLAAFASALVSCAETETTTYGESNSPNRNTSSIPWNRPERWEGGAGLGMMQSTP